MIKRNREYLPTATEIKKACERIQGTWSERERKKRAGEKAPPPWTPPTIDATVLEDNTIDNTSATMN